MKKKTSIFFRRTFTSLFLLTAMRCGFRNPIGWLGMIVSLSFNHVAIITFLVNPILLWNVFRDKKYFTMIQRDKEWIGMLLIGCTHRFIKLWIVRSLIFYIQPNIYKIFYCTSDIRFKESKKKNTPVLKSEQWNHCQLGRIHFVLSHKNKIKFRMSIWRLEFRTSVTLNAIDSFDNRITSRVVARSNASISRWHRHS